MLTHETGHTSYRRRETETISQYEVVRRLGQHRNADYKTDQVQAHSSFEVDVGMVNLHKKVQSRSQHQSSRHHSLPSNMWDAEGRNDDARRNGNDRTF